MKWRVIADVLLGSILLIVGIAGPLKGVFQKTMLSPLGGVILLGIAILTVAVWLYNRSTTGRGEETGRGGIPEEWLQWVVGICAGLLLLSYLPAVFTTPEGKEHETWVRFFVLPFAAVIVFSSVRLFFVSFVMGIAIVYQLSSFGAGPLRLALAAAICIVSCARGILGIIRAVREASR
ncbi:MAG TPA: hypothetical protein PLM14_14670 [Candidatus Hydrogenedentes bacterium]|nr:hypothetical protein [Candidatus Hydrogenedentota bacterium]HQH51446.1 hypothetical protein [Candidatus Hydrogenedentota bacterium]